MPNPRCVVCAHTMYQDHMPRGVSPHISRQTRATLDLLFSVCSVWLFSGFSFLYFLSQRWSLRSSCRPPAALVGRAAAACHSGAQSPPWIFFSLWVPLGFGEIKSILCMDSTVNNPRTLDTLSQCTLSRLTAPLLRSGCSDTSHRIHQGCFCTSAAVYSCRPLPHWIWCSFSHWQIKASVPAFCSYWELLMPDASSVVCKWKNRDCFF